MKYLTLVGVVLAMALTACGGSKLHAAATNPEAKQAEVQAEGIVKSCVAKGTSKKVLLGCLAPKGHSKELKDCLIKVAIHDAIHHVRLIKDASHCVVMYR